MHRMRNAGILLLITLATGVSGYMIIEGWSFHDALYMTVITLTTVGFREVQPLDTAGQYFTMGLLFVGVGTVFYILIAAIEFMVEGHFSGILRKRKVLRATSRLTNHYILCGYGRVGVEVAREFSRAGETLVVIEQDDEAVKECSQDGFLCIKGDATRDEILEEAGIHHAKGLLATLASDTKNVVVTLTARVLNPSIFIVARAEEDESHRKLKHAGADRTISPYSIGGRRMATMMLRPHVTDYLDLVTRGEQLKLRIEEVEVASGSVFVGLPLREARIRERSGASVVAIYRGRDNLIVNPSADTSLLADDVLLVIGDAAQLEKLNDLMETSQPLKITNVNQALDESGAVK